MVLVAVLLFSYGAYRNLVALRVAVLLAIAFYGNEVLSKWGDGFPLVSFILFAFIILLGVLAYPNYRADAHERFVFSNHWKEFFAGLMPPTILISFALGSILLGFAMPAEAAAMGTFGSLLLIIVYRDIYFLRFF